MSLVVAENFNAAFQPDRLSELTGKRYRTLVYLHFLKSMNCFTSPPTGFDCAFSGLGIDFRTLWQRSCKSYLCNATPDGLLQPIVVAAGLKTVRPVDAHLFCWIFHRM